MNFWLNTIIAMLLGISGANVNAAEKQFVRVHSTTQKLKMSNDTSPNYQVPIYNSSSFPDKIISIQLSCGCLRAEFPDTPIAPKTSENINISINVSNEKNFRLEHIAVLWESKRVTKLTIANAKTFRMYPSDRFLSWKKESSGTQKTFIIYMDDQVFNEIYKKDCSIKLESTTGAYQATLESIDDTKKCYIFSVKQVDKNVSTDILKVIFPIAISNQQSLLFCKIE